MNTQHVIVRDLDDKTADEKHGSICDDCQVLASYWAHEDSNGDERLLCKTHVRMYKKLGWRIETV